MTYHKAEEMLQKEVGYDYIIEAHQTPDFYEFRVSIGGDILDFRVYEDGKIYER